MDALVEFCRTGELGPLHLGITAAEVERQLGEPHDIRWVQRDSHWQRYRYGSISLMLMADVPDAPAKEDLRLRRIRVDLHRGSLDLPSAIAATTRDAALEWSQASIDELLHILGDNGIEVSLQNEDLSDGELYQRFRAGAGVAITAFDGRVDEIEAG